MSDTAVVMLSGGLDSTTALAWAINTKGWLCHTIAFDYGQRHRVELEAAENISGSLGAIRHHLLKVDIASFGGSALTSDIGVPKDHADIQTIPVTYVPARNLIFLSIATALAETISASHIVIGANIVDYSGYPDCRPEFLDAFLQAARLGTKAGSEGRPLKIEAPLIAMSKAEIIKLGLQLGVDYSQTRSCYDPDSNGAPCGHCDSCLFRRQGFSEIGMSDPLIYRD